MSMIKTLILFWSSFKKFLLVNYQPVMQGRI